MAVRAFRSDGEVQWTYLPLDLGTWLHVFGLFCKLKAKTKQNDHGYTNLVSWVAKLRQKIVWWSKIDTVNSLMAIEEFCPFYFFPQIFIKILIALGSNSWVNSTLQYSTIHAFPLLSLNFKVEHFSF